MSRAELIIAWQFVRLMAGSMFSVQYSGFGDLFSFVHWIHSFDLRMKEKFKEIKHYYRMCVVSIEVTGVLIKFFGILKIKCSIFGVRSVFWIAQLIWITFLVRSPRAVEIVLIHHLENNNAFGDWSYFIWTKINRFVMLLHAVSR